MIRVYVPATLSSLADAHRTGKVTGDAHAVTPALREWYSGGDVEELEFAALLGAAHSSLRLLAAEPAAPTRRVVLAADVPDSSVVPGSPDDAPSRVRLSEPVAWQQVVSIHVDEQEAAGDVAAAATAIAAADAGDEDAAFVVDGADGHDLLWFDVVEVSSLIVPP